MGGDLVASAYDTVCLQTWTSCADWYLSQGGGGGVFPPKTHCLIKWYFWFPDFSGCKPYTRKVNVSSSNHEVSTFWTLFRFMTVVYINAVQYQTCPNHESDNHFFAKIPGGVRTPGPPLWIRPWTLLALPDPGPAFVSKSPPIVINIAKKIASLVILLTVLGGHRAHTTCACIYSA